MNHLLSGFTDELQKLAAPSGMSASERREYQQLYRSVRQDSGHEPTDTALSKIRGKGRRVSRDYLASTALGAVASPAAMLLGMKLTKSVHNRNVLKAMASSRSRKQRKELARLMDTRPLVVKGGGIGVRGQKSPIATPAQLAGAAAQGGLMGSVVQMLRDRFSGSAGLQG